MLVCLFCKKLFGTPTYTSNTTKEKNPYEKNL
jgi:hypothetical protein